MINAHSQVVQQIGAERVAPVDAYILDWGIRETVSIEHKGISRWIVLVGMRVAAEDVVFLTGIEVDLYIVLAIVEGLNLSVGRIVGCSWPGRCWIQRRREEGRSNGIDRRGDHVVKKRGISRDEGIIQLIDYVALAVPVITDSGCEAGSTNISEIATALCKCENAQFLGGRRVIETLRLVVEEEK